MIPGRFKRPRAIKTPGLCDAHHSSALLPFNERRARGEGEGRKGQRTCSCRKPVFTHECVSLQKDEREE